MQGLLMLADGDVFTGELIGTHQERIGEVVFTTAPTGYEEVITDPSFFGQIVTMSYPLIGTSGINGRDAQSDSPRLTALIVRELCEHPSHWRSTGPVANFLDAHGVPVLTGVDTRALTRRLRRGGTTAGIIAPASTPGNVLQDRLGAWSQPDLVAGVTTDRLLTFGTDGPHTVVIDLGVKRSIIDRLLRLDHRLTVVPAHCPEEEVRALQPDGILVSNGPGDPERVGMATRTVAGVLGSVPVMGICLGFQVIALACGADSYRMKFGHRGGNHPVRDLCTNRVYITSQNHGYAIADQLRGTGLRVSARNLHDGSVEAVEHERLPLLAVQYHPEGGPGPFDSDYLFDRFDRMVRSR